MHYDVFNGDADGIFALHQYRLKYPLTAIRPITGVKRDIGLLNRLTDVKDSTISVFDISLNSNRNALLTLLGNNNRVDYFDHHFAGEIPDSPLLTPVINPSAETCTSLIVNDFIGSDFPLWAICGAFGDNLHRLANQMARQHKLSLRQTAELKELGELFNYNGYGATLDDLHFTPEHLYTSVKPYRNPFDYIAESSQLTELRAGYAKDMERALKQTALPLPGKNRIYSFPDKPWSRRVAGAFSNLKAREKPGAAHAIFTENQDSTIRISVRAPLNDKRDADSLCSSFPSGGGRAAAAGINNLPADRLEAFIDAFQKLYSSQALCC
jgi:hypothetical protein